MGLSNLPEPNDDIQRIVAQHAGGIQTTVCLSSRVLLISEDRLELALQEGIEKIEGRTAWYLPGGILLTSLATLVTSSFHDLFGIPASVWKAIFVIIVIVSCLWFFITLKKRVRFNSKDFVLYINSVGSQYNHAENQPTGYSIETQTREFAVSFVAEPSGAQKATIAKVRRAPARNPTPATTSRPIQKKSKPLSNILQCRQCGGSVYRIRGSSSVCATCNSIN